MELLPTKKTVKIKGVVEVEVEVEAEAKATEAEAGAGETSINVTEHPGVFRENRYPADFACVLPGCSGNGCAFGHPSLKDTRDYKRFFCQFGHGCWFHETDECFNSHRYWWVTWDAPERYVCQRWAAAGGATHCHDFVCIMHHPDEPDERWCLPIDADERNRNRNHNRNYRRRGRRKRLTTKELGLRYPGLLLEWARTACKCDSYYFREDFHSHALIRSSEFLKYADLEFVGNKGTRDLNTILQQLSWRWK